MNTYTEQDRPPLPRLTLLAAIAVFICAGCSLEPMGQISDVGRSNSQQRQGSVYLVRGLLGPFSLGMDKICQELRQHGVHAVVFQHSQEDELADALGREYSATGSHEPLVLIGHSLGADDVVNISRKLTAKNIRITLMITVDPVMADPVPGNVAQTINFYRSNGVMDALPIFRGIPLKPGQGSEANLVNLNLNKHEELLESGTNHFTIDKNSRVRQAIVLQVLEVCPAKPGYAGVQPARVGASSERAAR